MGEKLPEHDEGMEGKVELFKDNPAKAGVDEIVARIATLIKRTGKDFQVLAKVWQTLSVFDQEAVELFLRDHDYLVAYVESKNKPESFWTTLFQSWEQILDELKVPPPHEKADRQTFQNVRLSLGLLSLIRTQEGIEYNVFKQAFIREMKKDPDFSGRSDVLLDILVKGNETTIHLLEHLDASKEDCVYIVAVWESVLQKLGVTFPQTLSVLDNLEISVELSKKK